MPEPGKENEPCCPRLNLGAERISHSFPTRCGGVDSERELGASFAFLQRVYRGTVPVRTGTAGTLDELPRTVRTSVLYCRTVVQVHSRYVLDYGSSFGTILVLSHTRFLLLLALYHAFVDVTLFCQVYYPALID